MTNELEKIIEYQTLDAQLRRIAQEYNKHPAKRKLDVVRNKFNEVQDNFDKNVDEAETMDAEIESAYVEFNSVFDEFEKLEAKFNACVNDEDKAKFLPQLEDVRVKLDSCKNRIAQRSDKIKQLTVTSVQALSDKKKIKDEYDKIKIELDKIRDKSAPERQRIEKQMKELEPTLNKELFATYLKHRADVKLPVFVEVVGTDPKDYACFCGIKLSQTSKSELETKPYCQCETCRRLVYKK